LIKINKFGINNIKMYDVIIIGAGPAGLTAAIYAARKNLKTIVLSMDVGGQTIWSFGVENYPGFRVISGIELVGKFEEHVREFGVELKTSNEVQSIKQAGNHFEVFVKNVKDVKYEGKTIIAASGKIPSKLNVPGENEFLGKGVAYCATCDAPIFAGKDVAVVGGGNSALEAAFQLSEIGEQIYIINASLNLSGDEITRDKVETKNNIEIINNSEVTEISGGKFVSGIRIKDKLSGGDKTINVQGVFIEIGSIPSTGFAKGFLEMNALNEIIINCRSETSVPGVFAAGDVTNGPAKQIISAAGDGCKAALAAYEYLMKIK
jgi:alkyl hydroperoxide reductase subunit F